MYNDNVPNVELHNPMKAFEELFLLNALSTNKKIDVVMPMYSLEIMFWKIAIHEYVNIYTYIHTLSSWHWYC